jgi:tRNA(fMet)-specific endonuclease VapC
MAQGGESQTSRTHGSQVIILDTDLFTLGQRPGNSPEALRLRARIAQIPPEEQLATTIITYEEQTRGWFAFLAKARNVAEQVYAYHRLYQHLDCFRGIYVVEFTRDAAAEFAGLRAMRLRVGTLDLKIAAIALANGATLVTRNLRDFAKVPGLDAQDWTAA